MALQLSLLFGIFSFGISNPSYCRTQLFTYPSDFPMLLESTAKQPSKDKRNSWYNPIFRSSRHNCPQPLPLSFHFSMTTALSVSLCDPLNKTQRTFPLKLHHPLLFSIVRVRLHTNVLYDTTIQLYTT